MFSFDSILETTQNNQIQQSAQCVEVPALIQSATISQPSIPQQSAQVMGDPSVFSDYAGNAQKILPVQIAPLNGPYGTIENKKGVFCDQKCINVVSNNYELHQPSEILQSFENVAKRGGLAINKVLFNRHNGGLLINAKFDECKIVGEKHDTQVTFYTSHCGAYKTFLSLSLLRIACFNQVPVLNKNKSNHIFAEKHYKNALCVATFEKLLEKIPALVSAYNTRAEILQDKTITFETFADLCAEKWKEDKTSKKWEKRYNKLKEHYYHGMGQDIARRDSAYKAFQAITHQNTHGLRNTTMREENLITKSAKESLEFEEILLSA